MANASGSRPTRRAARVGNEERPRPRSAFYDHYGALPAGTDFRKRPDLYRVGRGEQGVLMVEPYKSELLPLWRFATRAAARASAGALYKAFLKYLRQGDFVGADMARKFIQMGYTRARRYANYRGGRKYREDGSAHARRARGDDVEKSAAAEYFNVQWRLARANEKYLKMKRAHQAKFG